MVATGELSLEELETALATDLDAPHRAEVETELGRRYVRRGDHDLALRHLVAARRHYETLGQLRERATVDVAIGTACTYKGEHERALSYLGRALDVADEIGDGDLRAHTINLLAEQAQIRGDVDRSEELWKRAREHFDQYWNGRELARCETGLAMIAAERRDLETAADYAERALDSADSSGDPLWIGRAQVARAVVYWHEDEFEKAKRFFRRAITLFQKNHLRRSLAEAYLRYGLFFGDMSDKLGPEGQDPAAFWLAKAQAAFRELGGLSDLERVREAFRRYGRRATDKVAEVEVLQMLQELKQSRMSVQRATQRLSMLVARTLEGPADAGTPIEDLDDATKDLIDVEQIVSRNLDEMALAEERFLGAVNAVVVERENIRSLIELTRALTAIRDHDALTSRMAELASQLTTGDRALVALATEDGKAEVCAAYGIDPDRDTAWRRHVEATAIKHGRADLLFHTPDETSNPQTEDGNGASAQHKTDPRKTRQHQLRLGYGMVVPLRRGDTVLGAVYVDKEITGGVFTERDLDLLVVFAGQATAILENRRIEEALRLAARVKAATLDAVTDGVISIDADGAITSINATASRILDMSRGDTRAKLPRLSEVHELGFLGGCLRRGEELDSRLVTMSSGEYLCNTRVIRGGTGEAVALVATFTEFKRATKLAQRMVGSTARYSFGDLVGDSSALKRALVLAQAAARSDSSVLITGESGTGKEIIAQAIHNGGPRASGPFVALNCAAIPRDLLESELFGYESGAFTGARKGGRPGKFELAEGGSILLDEIGDMPLEMQVKLLRVLQERHAQRLGSTREIPLNCRILTTTNRDLATEVAHGLFRQDLFFRLRVIHIDVPPLRERPEDIARLTEHFLQVFSARMGKQLLEVEPRVMDVLKAYPWPGNVRELEHVLEGEVNLAPKEAVSLSEVPVMLEQSMNQQPPVATLRRAPTHPLNAPPIREYLPPQYPAAPQQNDSVKTMSESERELLEAALIAHRGKIPEVARALGVSRGTVYNKMKKFKIDPASYRA